ncbi:MAG TPA: hypothetical protein VKF14_09725 [Candidatus Dormibacteraeota bacterium]|nr:hypothetical protein [Candidatus Dormibacteraeota bacterium]
MPQPGGFGDPEPERIPSSYYARATGPRLVTPRRRFDPRRARLLDGLRGLSIARRAVLVLGSLLGIIWAVQVAWHHALGLLGLLVIATTVLGTNAWDLRSRVPLLGSPRPLTGFAGWAVLGVLLVVFGLAARPASTSTAPRLGEGVARAATPAGRPTATPLLAPSAVPIVTNPTATPEPTPTPRPPATATPVGSRITIILMPPPFNARRGQSVAFSIRTTAHTACSIAIGYAGAPALPPAMPDAAGNASWTWLVGPQAPLGRWPIRVTCGTGSGNTTITIVAGA